MRCRTSRFPTLPTPGPVDPHEHSHGSHELVLPLSRPRGRCPERGRIELSVSTPPGAATHEVVLRAKGAELRERVPSGPEVALTASVALAGSKGRVERFELTVDGRPVELPAVEVIP